MVLIRRTTGLSTISGAAKTPNKESHPNLDVELSQDGLPAGAVRTDPGGKFQLKLRVGQYDIKPLSEHGIEFRENPVSVTLD